MQTFRVSLAALYNAPLKGIEVKVPTGTRSIRLAPTAAAVPVEVWPESSPPDAKAQDGQLLWSAGETLYPGDTLLLRAGITTCFVRLPPSNNAGAQQWITAGGAGQPFGEDARRAQLYALSAYANADFVDGPCPTSDGVAAGMADGQLVFVSSPDLQLHSGQALATIPNTMRLPASFTEGARAAEPNLNGRASVTNSMRPANDAGAPPAVHIVSPWHIVPAGLLLRFQRLRLRITVGQAWKASTSSYALAVFSSGTSSASFPLAAAKYTPMGCVANVAALGDGRQLSQLGSTTWTIDLGTPSDAFSVLQGNSDLYIASLTFSPTDWSRWPKISAEWLLDEGTPRTGHVETFSVLDTLRSQNHVPAGETWGVVCHSPRGAHAVQVNCTIAGTDAELRAWPVDKVADVDVSTAPAFSTPVVSGTGTAFTLPAGSWFVAIYGGSGSSVRAHVWTQEG